MATIERESGSSADTQVTGSFDGVVPVDVRVPALTILAHPEPGRVGERVILPELPAGSPIRLGRGEPEFAVPGSPSARTLDCVHLSRRPLFLVPGPGPGEVSIERAGCSMPAAVDGERLDERRTLSAAEIERGTVVLLGHRVALLFHLDAPMAGGGPAYGMVGASLEMRRLREEVKIAARLDVPVLLRGESGTGKELLARAIHDASGRRERPYLTLNMAAVPRALAAAELFGAVRGAFTGADRKRQGYFRRAAGGTLFLDEIGETPDEVQPLLLRVLESGEIQTLGSAEPRRVDVRVIAATDADLEARAGGGSFRKALLHRLAGYEIRLPPLRARRSDFGRLLFHFLGRELERLGAADALAGAAADPRPWPPAGLVARLARCEWPGNVRQLKNVARRMAIARVAGTALRLEPELLGEPAAGPAAIVREGGPQAPPPAVPSPAVPHLGWRPAYRKPSEITDKELLATLRDHRYELKASAEALGVSRGSIYSLIEANPRIRKATELERGEVAAALERAGGEVAAAAVELEVSVHGLRRRVKALLLSDATPVGQPGRHTMRRQ